MKKSITILAALLLLSTTTALAAEYPTEVSYTADNGTYEIRKTYELPVGSEPSQEVRQDFRLDGYSYQREHHYPRHLRDESASIPLVCAGPTDNDLM